MGARSGRWRLIELTRTREAVRRGIDLLDRKREALTRELLERRGTVDTRREALAVALETARQHLDAAFEELGSAACEAAALAQASPVELDVRDSSVLGVRLPRLSARLSTFQISYGPSGTSASLDDAARLFAALIQPLVELATLETAVRNLQHALQRTARTLNALKEISLPGLEAEIRGISAAIEEEERDGRVRAGHRGVSLRPTGMVDTIPMDGLKHPERWGHARDRKAHHQRDARRPGENRTPRRPGLLRQPR